MKTLFKNLLFVFIFILSIIESLSINITSNKQQLNTIKVEIRGEVKQEKVITTKIGSTLEDIINEIELTDKSDISDLALNSKLYNNEIISIRKKSNSNLISINNATLEELCKINGIGKQTALKIIKYRQNNGSFHTLEELMNISGIGAKKFEKIKEYITL